MISLLNLNGDNWYQKLLTYQAQGVVCICNVPQKLIIGLEEGVLSVHDGVNDFVPVFTRHNPTVANRINQIMAEAIDNDFNATLIQELAEIMGVAAAKFDNTIAHVNNLFAHWRSWSEEVLPDDINHPLLGPHAGKEYELMLRGEKNISAFLDEVPPVFLHEMANARRFHYLHAHNPKFHIFYHTGHQADAARLEKVIEMNGGTGRTYYPRIEREIGRLLGYSDEAVQYYLDRAAQRGATIAPEDALPPSEPKEPIYINCEY